MDSVVTAILDVVLVTGFVLVDGLLLASVVALAIFLWRLLSGRTASATRSGHSSRQIALQILEERYQRGEIDAVELEGRRALLHRER